MRRIVLLLPVILLISAGFVYYGYRRLAPRIQVPENIPELIFMLPADSSYLLYADLAALRSSAFMAKFVALLPPAEEEPEYAEFVRATGFDFSRDLDRVAIGIRNPSRTMSLVALAEGRFDREKISHYALRSGRREKHKGSEVFWVPGSRPSQPVAFAFLAANRVALGDGASLASLLPPRPNHFDSALRERIARVAGSVLFVVGGRVSVPENVSFAGWHSDQLNRLLGSLRGFTLAVQPAGERMKVTVEGECDTTANARQLVGLVEGLRLLARAALADPKARSQIHPEAAALLEAIVRSGDVSQREQRVQLRFELTAAAFGRKAVIRSGPQ